MWEGTVNRANCPCAQNTKPFQHLTHETSSFAHTIRFKWAYTDRCWSNETSAHSVTLPSAPSHHTHPCSSPNPPLRDEDHLCCHQCPVSIMRCYWHVLCVLHDATTPDPCPKLVVFNKAGPISFNSTSKPEVLHKVSLKGWLLLQCEQHQLTKNTRVILNLLFFLILYKLVWRYILTGLSVWNGFTEQ